MLVGVNTDLTSCKFTTSAFNSLFDLHPVTMEMTAFKASLYLFAVEIPFSHLAFVSQPRALVAKVGMWLSLSTNA
jgi:hypothetical protein